MLEPRRPLSCSRTKWQFELKQLELKSYYEQTGHAYIGSWNRLTQGIL